MSSAPTTIPADAIRVGDSSTLRFEGRDHGSSISFFLVTTGPGQGPGLHRHPYDETWTVLEGEATFEVDGHVLVAHAGETSVAPAEAWHGFTNTGDGVLRLICIHASPVMVQEWAEQPDQS